MSDSAKIAISTQSICVFIKICTFLLFFFSIIFCYAERMRTIKLIFASLIDENVSYKSIILWHYAAIVQI